MYPSFSQTYWARVKSNSDWAYINTTGKEVLLCQYEHCKDFSEGLAMVRNGNWGFIDMTGKNVIPIEHDHVNPFHQGLSNADLWFMDKTGKFVFNSFRFKKARDFSEGLAAASDIGKWGYIDLKGAFVIDQKYDRAGDFSEGLAAVSIDDHWYYIGPDGKVAVDLADPAIVATTGKGTFAQEFPDGFATIRSSKGWGAIDSTGKVVIKPSAFPRLDNIGNGWFKEVVSTGEFNFVRLVNKEGKSVKKVDGAKEFSDGLLAVKVGKLWGFLDEKLNEPIMPSFESVGNFVNRLAPAKSHGLWGYIDKTGVFVIPASYKSAEEFHRVD
ncbi:MAG: WG repeat-containing protein [Cytophagales bacterium]|nr:WG repeat-containing protein [Cytophagales bacterium]